MGTSWSLQAVAPPEGVVRGVEAAFDRVVAQMSQWEPESALSRINRAPPGEWHPVPPEFARVLAAAIEITEASCSAFHPAPGSTAEHRVGKEWGVTCRLRWPPYL